MAIIQKLGLRYQPNSIEMLDDHRGKIALLIQDVADLIPADTLQKACDAWVVSSAFMPKASDLLKLARDSAGQQKVPSSGYGGEEFLIAQNARRTNHNVEWFYDEIGGQREMRLRHIAGASA